MKAAKRKPWAVRFLCVLPVFPLLMIGSDILVPSLEHAGQLEFGWVRPVYAIGYISLLSYFGLGFWLRRWIGAWSWAIAFAASLLLCFIPTWIFALNTRSIPVNHFFNVKRFLLSNSISRTGICTTHRAAKGQGWLFEKVITAKRLLSTFERITSLHRECCGTVTPPDTNASSSGGSARCPSRQVMT